MWLGYTWSGCTDSSYPESCDPKCEAEACRPEACKPCRFPKARDASPFPRRAALEEDYAEPPAQGVQGVQRASLQVVKGSGRKPRLTLLSTAPPLRHPPLRSSNIPLLRRDDNCCYTGVENASQTYPRPNRPRPQPAGRGAGKVRSLVFNLRPPAPCCLRAARHRAATVLLGVNLGTVPPLSDIGVMNSLSRALSSARNDQATAPVFASNRIAPRSLSRLPSFHDFSSTAL